MEPIYVTGHRNPDTDSVVSAIAYAALRNALGNREYVPARLGHLSDETKLVLERFGFEPPERIRTMRTQIRDLAYDTPPALNAAVTVLRAWNALQADRQIPAIPVTDDSGGLLGMLSPSELAEYDMQTALEPCAQEIPVFSLISVLEGELVGGSGGLIDTVSGEVVTALPREDDTQLFSRPDRILLCGNQPDVVRRAIESGVVCVVVCQASVTQPLPENADHTCVIVTPFEACRAARLIFQAIPVSRICRKEDLMPFHTDDYLDEVREEVLKSRHRNYPILDEKEKVIGTLSRYHLLRPRRKRVVLVDHNEMAQSVPGLEQAEILEIIDHHRLADIQTRAPIFVRNEPVGSTATIIAGMFQEHGVMPPAHLAGLMAAAIVSDTVIFKSPTTTERDRCMARRMARLAGISLDELGKNIFAAAGMMDKPVEELLFSDFKDFRIAGHTLGVGQIICVDSSQMLARKQEFLGAMQSAGSSRGYSMMLLMLTDVLLAGTHLFYLGDDDTIRQAFGADAHDHECFLPKVISRKKQVVPMLSALWG